MKLSVDAVHHYLKVDRVIVQLVAILVVYNLTSPQLAVSERFGNHTVQGGAESPRTENQVSVAPKIDVSVFGGRAHQAEWVAVGAPSLVVLTAIPSANGRQAAIVHSADGAASDNRVGGSVPFPPLPVHQAHSVGSVFSLASGNRAGFHIGKIA